VGRSFVLFPVFRCRKIARRKVGEFVPSGKWQPSSNPNTLCSQLLCTIVFCNQLCNSILYRLGACRYMFFRVDGVDPDSRLNPAWGPMRDARLCGFREPCVGEVTKRFGSHHGLCRYNTHRVCSKMPFPNTGLQKVNAPRQGCPFALGTIPIPL